MNPPTADIAIPSPPTRASESRFRRLRPNINLRTLIVLVLVSGSLLGLYLARKRQQGLRSWAIATATKTGAELEYDGDHEVVRMTWTGGSISPSTLPQVPISDQDFAALSGFPRLREVVMIVGIMSDAGLARLGGLPQIRHIFAFKPNVTDAGLAHLAGTISLRELDLLRSPGITDTGLAHLANLTALETLNLSGASIEGPGLAHLAGLTKLQTLTIPNTPLGDSGLEQLGRLRSLKTLYIGGASAQYTDAGIKHLTALTNLKELGIGSSQLTEAGMKHVAQLSQLELLQLDSSQINDAWLEPLAAMKSLRTLHISGTTVSAQAIDRLKRALPAVQVYVNGRPQ